MIAGFIEPFLGKCSVRGCGARAAVPNGLFYAFRPGARFVSLPNVFGEYLLCGAPKHELDNVDEKGPARNHADRWVARSTPIEDAPMSDGWKRTRKAVAFRDFMEEMALEIQNEAGGSK